MSPAQARRLLAEGSFGTGSMGPKVDAAASFAEATGFPAYIAQLLDGARALTEQVGTRIVPDRLPALKRPGSGKRLTGTTAGAVRLPVTTLGAQLDSILD